MRTRLMMPPASCTDDAAPQIQCFMAQQHEQGIFQGSVLVAQNGAVIHKGGYGLADRESQTPNAVDTQFRIGSLTKPFTAILVMQLVQDGKVKLDGAICDYLPAYRPDMGKRVTIEHLLTHTSGIPSYTRGRDAFQEFSRRPRTVDEFVHDFCSGDLEFEPGAQHTYSNSGYYILGAIIETVSDEIYEKALRERVLDPAGMKASGCDRPDMLLDRRANGYVKRDGDLCDAPFIDMRIPFAAGAMYSTVEDLYRFDQTLYTDNLLSAESKEAMWRWRPTNYSYGWFVRKPLNEKRSGARTVISHTGAIEGFNSVFERWIEEKTVIVLLSNVQCGVVHLEAIARGLRDILDGETPGAPELSESPTTRRRP
ncbi:MAG: serine hydrolase [Candidatus Sumerlaeota bacterium]|nr:serine hydrolase [Candidatus Sumerlaeota bacterium]